MEDMRWPAKVFLIVFVVGAVALGGLLLSISGLPERQQLGLVVVLAALVTLAASFPVHGAPQTKYSLHTTVIFAAILLFEPGIALVIAGLGMLLAQMLRRQPWDQSLFNTALVMLQAALSGLVLVLGGWNYDFLQVDHPTLVLFIGIAAVVMYLVEATAIAIIAALHSGESVWHMWRQVASFDLTELLAQFALGLIGAIVLDGYLWTLPLLLPPAVVVYRSSARQAALQQQAQVLAYEASHDALTRLPNRMLFMDRLQHAQDRSRRRDTTIAVLFLDLDRFKVINDSLGHDVGDQVLVVVAERLRDCMRPEDTIARIGGDEFTVLLEEIGQPSDVTHIANRIIGAFQAPFHCSGYALVVSTSIGIALSTSGHKSPEDMLRDADVAMYRAKANGQSSYEFFNVDMSVQAMDRLERETALRQASERQEFRVYYQPIVDMRSGRIASFEALVRWEHPQDGLIAPASFIPLAEETGLIVGIDRWVLETACRQMQCWHKQYSMSPPIRISVNVSAHDLKYGNLPDEVRRIIAGTGIDPHLLQLEITESAMLENVQAVHAALQVLKDMGVEVAIDDFGTGYSSLRYLQRFPVETLKIDKGFVEDLRLDGSHGGIVEAINRMADSLRMEVVAEGIETAQQIIQLQRLGCNLGQGYYFSKPIPDQAVDQVLAEGGHYDIPITSRAIVYETT